MKGNDFQSTLGFEDETPDAYFTKLSAAAEHHGSTGNM